MHLKLENIPPDMTVQYLLQDKAIEDGWVYVEIWEGTYGLQQAGLLAQEQLEKCLEYNGYQQSKLTPGLWTHDKRKIQFCLIVDDVDVKYIEGDNADHLKQVLEQHNEITTYLGGTKYVGLTIDWQYKTNKYKFQCQGTLLKP